MAKFKDAPATVIELSIHVSVAVDASDPLIRVSRDVVIGLFESEEDALKMYRLIKANNNTQFMPISMRELPNPRITKSGCILLDSDRVF